MPQAALPFPSIDPIAVEIGPVIIRWYGLAYVAGLLLGYVYVKKLCGTERLWLPTKNRITAGHLEDFLLFAGLGVIIGGRLGFVLFYNADFYLKNPIAVLKIWEGGMAFHGGLLGVLAAIILYTRANRLSFLSFCDIIACAAPFGLFFGRVANFINAELWGRPTEMPWGVIFPGAGAFPRHPSQLYEAVLEGLMLWLIIRFLTHHRNALKMPGLIAGVFGIGYGSARIFVEFFREPDQHIGYLAGNFITMGMILSLPVWLGGLVFLFASQRAHSS